jgi:hypothetical protein
MQPHVRAAVRSAHEQVKRVVQRRFRDRQLDRRVRRLCNDIRPAAGVVPRIREQANLGPDGSANLSVEDPGDLAKNAHALVVISSTMPKSLGLMWSRVYKWTLAVIGLLLVLSLTLEFAATYPSIGWLDVSSRTTFARRSAVMGALAVRADTVVFASICYRLSVQAERLRKTTDVPLTEVR